MQENTLATDVIRAAKKRSHFWFAAFILALAALVISHHERR